jgi:nucleoside-diphosphate-sugar epimerase
MSSIVAVMPGKQAPSTFDERDWNNWAEPMVEQEGKNAGGRVIYCASKTAAERALWKFRDENNLPFAITAINPA